MEERPMTDEEREYVEKQTAKLKIEALVVLKKSPAFASYVSRIEQECADMRAALGSVNALLDSFVLAARTGDALAFSKLMDSIKDQVTQLSKPFLDRARASDVLVEAAESAIQRTLTFSDRADDAEHALRDLLDGLEPVLDKVSGVSDEKVRVLKQRVTRYKKEYARG